MLKKGTKWIVGDGKTRKFWKDLWIGDQPLLACWALYQLRKWTVKSGTTQIEEAVGTRKASLIGYLKM